MAGFGCPPRGGGTTSIFPFEKWRYKYIEDVGTDVVLEFVDPSMSAEYRMTTDPAEKDALRFIPIVNRAPVALGSGIFHVAGEVHSPGSYPLNVPTTVLQALVNAGGFKAFAQLDSIVIQRGDQRLNFNYQDLILGRNKEQNIRLQPGDIIVVK